MLGLFGTLNLGTRSLQTQQTGVEVTGQNLANVNNPAYARQRVQIQSSISIPSAIGPQGTGAEVVSINQLRDELLDGQIRSETSVGGYWQAQQTALQNAQANLGEYLDRNADGVNSTSATGAAGASSSLSDAINGLFNAFQNVATSPTSLTERQSLINAAQKLSTLFNQTSDRLTQLRDTLNASVTNDVASANQLLADIAKLNDQIARAELPLGGKANELRDLREQKLESLAKLVSFETSTGSDGSVGISIDGQQFVSGNHVTDTLATFGRGGQYNGGNELLVMSVNAQRVLNSSGGSLAGSISARDGALQDARASLDTLALNIISQVDAIHQTGFSPSGTTGLGFFGGNSAATMYVSHALVTDPSQIQASGAANTPGDNSIALALAELATTPQGSLGNQTFSGYFSKVVADFGYSLKTANDQLSSHETVNTLLLKQRDSVSGVSIDEEMTNLLTYQKAYQASAKIVTTVDEMLDTILSLKR